MKQDQCQQRQMTLTLSIKAVALIWLYLTSSLHCDIYNFKIMRSTRCLETEPHEPVCTNFLLQISHPSSITGYSNGGEIRVGKPLALYTATSLDSELRSMTW